MDLVVCLAFMLAPLYLIYWLTKELAPTLTTFLERLVRRLIRAGFQTVWTKPMRRFGFLMTIWLWLIGLAGCSTCLACVAVGSAGAQAGGLLLMPAALWTLVVAGWWGLRWLARRRYTPRAMPTRRRRR